MMEHLGDISKINGAEIEPVDVITAGSPCQDLSVAGKRAGLAGERSGLFMEQMRIIKEMRNADKERGRTGDAIRPRYMVWENVPGAFSSNGGEDFRCVLEETARIVEEDAAIPGPPKGGRWSNGGCIVGDGWSLAWKLHDAQFWGVPQRRKRISLVADFGGASAPEILFVGKGVFGDIESSNEERKGIAEDTETSTGKAISFQERAGKPGGGKGILIQNERTGALSTLNNQSVCAFEPGAASRVGGHVYEDDKAGTIRANAGDNQQAVAYGISSYASNAMLSDNPHSGIYEADTSRTLDLNGGNPGCNQGGIAIVAGFCTEHSANARGIGYEEECSPTLRNGTVPATVCLEGNGSRPSHKGDEYAESDVSYTLNSTEQHAVAYRKTGHPQNAEQGQGWEETNINDTLNAFDNGESRTPTVVVAVENHPTDSRVKISEDGVVQTLSARMGTGGGNVPLVMEMDEDTD